MQDLQTGEVMEIKPSHSFFWIKMEYWLGIKVVLGGICIAIALQKGAV